MGVFSAYDAYEQVYVLATAGGPGSGHYADFSVTLTYTDGTTSQTTYRLYDWYDTTKVTNVEQIASYMRQTNGVSTAGWDGSTTKGSILHSAAISADKTKLLKSNTEVSNAGTAYTFGAITYDRVGEYTYTVTEVAGNDSIITYDSHECTVYVKVEDKDGVLTIAESSSVTPADGLTFTNSFTPAPISGEAISGGVSLDGRDADEGEFTIKVTDKDGNTVEVKPGTDGSFSLDAPTFTETGVYEYTVSQEPGGRGGVTYDNSVYTVTYKVTENPETHELVVERKITKTEGTAESKDVDAIEFKNTYAPVGELRPKSWTP